jgi:predicted DNA-binding transcriptional regulator YafY
MRYYTRSGARRDQRTVSPQRLVYYRDNWYLDAWCHLRDGLRTFGIDAIETVQALEEPSLEVSAEELDSHFAGAYGIFAGAAEHRAVLRFEPMRARYVATERWHRDQHGEMLPDGRYQLSVPYGNPAELVMDILKYGPDCEVIEPLELRDLVAERLAAALARYGERSG